MWQVTSIWKLPSRTALPLLDTCPEVDDDVTVNDHDDGHNLNHNEEDEDDEYDDDDYDDDDEEHFPFPSGVPAIKIVGVAPV